MLDFRTDRPLSWNVSHFIDGRTGDPFAGRKDDVRCRGDGILFQGLCAYLVFQQQFVLEKGCVTNDRLWLEAEWDWYTGREHSLRHWAPLLNRWIGG
jgi:hypothetical protein